jgi:cytochrome c oxidase assembly protein subunit 11
MNGNRLKNVPVLLFAGTVLAVMIGLVIYSPTLYQMFCGLTGYGGTVQRAPPPRTVATSGDTVTVHFDANVAPGLPWEFRPEQRKVAVHFNEPTQVYYYAKNNADHTVVARAAFNVTPYQAAPYFFKIECFCFTDEKLGPGESARMPLVLYVDEQLLSDMDTELFHDITLSYTFFEQDHLTADQIKSARDLKKGSEASDAKLKSAGSVDFENDAPRG